MIKPSGLMINGRWMLFDMEKGKKLSVEMEEKSGGVYNISFFKGVAGDNYP